MTIDDIVKQALNTSVLPDLPSSLLSSLPPLPPISDPDLLRVATTHSSVLSKARDRYNLTLNEEIQDYEKLEHVGDAILGSVVTVLLHDMYPNLREGAATLLKHHLVSNRTLAQIAAAYHLPKKLIASQSALYATREQTKTKGSMLESWIAAAYYSYLQEKCPTEATDETGGASCQDDPTASVVEAGESRHSAIGSKQKPLDEEQDESEEREIDEVQEKISNLSIQSVESIETQLTQCDEDMNLDVPSQKPEDNVSENPSQDELATDTQASIVVQAEPTHQSVSKLQSTANGEVSETLDPRSQTRPKPAARHTGEAYLFIDAWLRALFTPIAEYAIEEMRKEQVRLSNIKDTAMYPEDKAMGASALLQSHCSRLRWEDPEITFDRTRSDYWKCRCAVTDGDGKVWMAEATRPNKRSGQNAAAFILCQEMGLFKDD